MPVFKNGVRDKMGDFLNFYLDNFPRTAGYATTVVIFYKFKLASPGKFYDSYFYGHIYFSVDFLLLSVFEWAYPINIFLVSFSVFLDMPCSNTPLVWFGPHPIYLFFNFKGIITPLI